MDEKITQLILKKGKKYKKWTEGVFVNPFYWVENGTPYYIVVYTKNTGSVASAFFAEGQENNEDALKAHPPLAIFSDLSTNIFEYGLKRAEVSLSHYTKPLSIPVNNMDSQVNQGREAFAQLSKLQQEYNEKMKDFTHYYDNDVLVRGQLTENDINKVRETVIEMDILQYKVGMILQERYKDIEAFAAFLEKQREWQKLDKDTHDFIKEITKNMDRAEKELRDMNILTDEDPENMFRLNYDRVLEKSKRAIEKQKANIRYPK